MLYFKEHTNYEEDLVLGLIMNNFGISVHLNWLHKVSYSAYSYVGTAE